MSQRAQFYARGFANFVTIQFGHVFVAHAGEHAVEPRISGAEALDGVFKPVGVTERRWQGL